MVFQYGQQRISPIQSGRYVPVPPDQEKAIEEVVAESTPPEEGKAGSTGNNAGAATAAVQTENDTTNQSTKPTPDNASSETTKGEGEDESASEAPSGGAGKRRLVRRDPSTEHTHMEASLAAGFRPAGNEAGDSLLIHAKDVSAAVAKLSGQGWAIVADQRMVRTAGTPSLSVVSGIDWFELRGGVKFTLEDGTETIISLPEILQAARSGRHMIELADGSHGLLSLIHI